MATPVSNAVALSGNSYVNGLVQGGAWTLAASRLLTYSFSLNDTPGGGSWVGNPLAQTVRTALEAWSAVANVGFVESASGSVFTASTADIAITLTGSELQAGIGAVALGIFPDPAFASTLLASVTDYTRAEYPRPEGDVFLDDSYIQATGTGLMHILHEIGHALGLKHPEDDGGNGRPTYSQLGIASYARTEHTVMATAGGSAIPTGPMVLDILAIQQIYGANTAYHTGNDVYGIAGLTKGIWDAGGIDTFDGSAYPSPVIIDLRPGSNSYAGGVTGIAYGVIIENAVGSIYGGDYITGNDAANRIDGGGGADQMTGGKGNDTYVVDDIGDAVYENPGEGADTVLSAISYALGAEVENLTLVGFAVGGTGNALANVITGNGARNILEGGGGNDYIDGGSGADRMSGNAGDDTYVVSDLQPAGAATVLHVEGAPGAYIVQGERTFSPSTGTFTFTLGDSVTDSDTLVDYLSVSYRDHGDGWGNRYVLDLSTYQVGKNFEPGHYTDANRQGFAGAGHPGLDFSGNGAGSNMLFGNFTIREAVFDYSVPGSPVVSRFSVEFEQRSEYPAAPPIWGTFNFNYSGAGGVSAERVIESPDEGTDTVLSGVDIVLPDNVERLVLTGSAHTAGTGNGLDNVISGNSGNNTLDGGGGNDTIYGGDGADTVVLGAGFDRVHGEAGTDTLDFSGATFGVATMLTTYRSWNILTDALVANAWGFEDVVGTAYGDYIVGDAGANQLSGGDGNDWLMGEAGNDTLHGGAGNDVVYGGAGNDTVYAGSGNDTIYSGSGFDYVQGEAGTDTLDFSGAAFGVATMLTIYRSWNILTDAWVANAWGIEDVVGTAYGDYIVGDAGANRLSGGGGNDWMLGDAGDDVLNGGAGDDTVFAGSGNDTIYSGSGFDTVQGEAGTDTLDFSGATFGVATMLTIYRSWNILTDVGVATAYGIEDVVGSAFGDYIVGDAGANSLTGGGGNDWLLGEAGNDVLHGGAGNDVLDGGAGNDTIYAGNGDDTIRVAAGFDTVQGEAGTDTLDFSDATFGVATMLGTYRSWNILTDALVATAWGIEDVVGSAYGDYIVGDAAANRLSGGGGNDWLIGDGGGDVLSGGGGSDVFDYNAITEGLDTVTDFVHGAGGDKLDIKDVLVGYNPGTSDIDDFVRLSGGASTTVSVNANGLDNDFVAIATLQNVAMSASLLNEMMSNGNLVVS